MDLVAKILDGILFIRGKRNRPCYNTLLGYVNRSGEITCDMDDLKLALDGMLYSGIVLDRGKNGCESFYINDDEIVADETLDLNQSSQPGIAPEMVTPKKATTEEVEFEEANPAEEFEKILGDVDSVFENILFKKIETEIEMRVNKAISSLIDSNNFFSNKNVNAMVIDYHNDPLIITLKDEISYLKEQLASKNEDMQVMYKSFNKVSMNKDNDQNKNKKSNKGDNKISSKTVDKNQRMNYMNSPVKKTVELVEKGNINITVRNEKSNDCEYVEIADKYNVSVDNAYELLSNYDDNENEGDYIDATQKTKSTNKGKKNNTRTINILGDSTIKSIQAHKMRRRIPANEKLYVKSFSGATVEDMKDYARPSVRRNPDLFVLHCGTNDLCTNKTANQIAGDIIKLGLELKHSNNDVMISSITPRADKLNDKGIQVNASLKIECDKYDFLFIDNSNILANKHLNGSGLHLNYKGTVTLAQNFLSYMKV